MTKVYVVVRLAPGGNEIQAPGSHVILVLRARVSSRSPSKRNGRERSRSDVHHEVLDACCMGMEALSVIVDRGL